MMIGFIFECGPQGADKQVCEYLAQQLRPGIALVSRTLDNKPRLLSEAPQVAQQLLAQGCCCVLIVWDLRPAWPNTKSKPCRATERQQLLQGLAQQGVPAQAPVYLVCIEQELESWLIACDHAINTYLSRPQKSYNKAKKVNRPDADQQPKARLIQHFKQAHRGFYDDKVHAVQLLRAAPVNKNKLRRSASFSRFETKLLGC